MKKVRYPFGLLKIFSLALIAMLLVFSNPLYAQEESASEPTLDLGGDPAAGRQLFNANCAACHTLDRKGVGPALRDVTQKYEREWLHKWITNSAAMVASGDERAVKVFNEYNGSPMQAFPQLSEQDIDNILAYTSQPKPEPVVEAGGGGEGGTASSGGFSNEFVLGLLAVVLLMLVIMLFLVSNVLKKIAEANGVEYPEEEKRTPLWKAFVKNQFLVLVSTIVLLLVGAYCGYGYLMQVGVDQGYAPVQPIHFSHKIHAGDNQIDCNFCHSSARVSKTSGIPSLNVCMSCHENIYEYNGEVDMASGYTKEFYDNEIAKLYEAVGWDPDERMYSGEEKPVKWVRVHNLPDLAYFNHSQHVNVAGLDCQTCHGTVEEMEIVEQFAPLTMGWCVDCHRTTDLKLKDNKYYEKIHAELSKKYGVEKLTVAQMGGLECGKCHY